jgi:hypothetical protein
MSSEGRGTLSGFACEREREGRSERKGQKKNAPEPSSAKRCTHLPSTSTGRSHGSGLSKGRQFRGFPAQEAVGGKGKQGKVAEKERKRLTIVPMFNSFTSIRSAIIGGFVPLFSA